jgi:hypothetical protein
MESNNTNNQAQPQSLPSVKFDINKLVAGTKVHRIHHQKRHDAERKASGKIKVTKEQQNKYNIRKRFKQRQSGIKQKRRPVTKEKQKENVERAKLKRHQKKEKEFFLRMEADAAAVLSSLLKIKIKNHVSDGVGYCDQGGVQKDETSLSSDSVSAPTNPAAATTDALSQGSSSSSYDDDGVYMRTVAGDGSRTTNEEQNLKIQKKNKVIIITDYVGK